MSKIILLKQSNKFSLRQSFI